MGDNMCCPYLDIIVCADTDEHKHVACRGSLTDSPGIDNEFVANWCLGDFYQCPLRPKGDG